MVSFTTSLEFSCLHFQDNFLCKDIRTLSYVTRNFYQMGWYILMLFSDCKLHSFYVKVGHAVEDANA